MLSKMLLRSYCLLIATLAFSAIFTHQAHSSQASEIIVKGNARTKTSYIEYLYMNCRSLEETDEPATMESCLLNSRLFSTVKVEKEDSKIIITATDRWTLIPIPFGRSDRGEKKVGLFLLERNLLGRGKMMVFGGSVGDQSHSLFLMYHDPQILRSDYYGVFKLKSGDEELYRYHGKNKFDGTLLKNKQLEVLLGLPFGRVNVAIGSEISKETYDIIPPFSFHPPENKSATFKTSLSYDNSHYRFYFQEGLSAKLETGTEVYQSGAGAKSTKMLFDSSWQKNIFSDHALQLSFGLNTLANSNSEDFLALGGDKGYRGVNQNGIWAKWGLGLSLDYQVPFNHASYGTWTVAPFLDYGRFEHFDDLSLPEETYGAGMGVYLYLKKIALPGLGLIAGHNPNFEESYFSAFIGGGM